MPLADLVAHRPQRLFTANWTEQEGGGRPLTKGTGAARGPVAAAGRVPRASTASRRRTRTPAPAATTRPTASPAAAATSSTNVFVLGQRFDFVTFDAADTLPTRGTRRRERASRTTLQTSANFRAYDRACSARATSRCWRGR